MAPGLLRLPESKKAAPQAACPPLPSYHGFPHVKFPARLKRNRLSVRGRDCRWCASWVRRNPVSSRLPERPPPGPAIEQETHACGTPPPSVPYRERWYEYSLFQRSSIGTYADCRRQTPLPLALPYAHIFVLACIRRAGCPGYASLRAPFVTLAKAGVHLRLPMPPQPAEGGPNRPRQPREPRLDPGSGAGATDGGNAMRSHRRQMCESGSPLAGEAGWGAASAPAGAAGEARQGRPSRREALPQPLPRRAGGEHDVTPPT